ncbi:RtcB family protein [Candidatus Woesearchaeota archaeon]|nr:RtcB family protein [Candidatus Woesearchaeota archaeon]
MFWLCMDIKKLNAYSYEVPRSGDMRVPVKIFASAPLLEKMQADNCVQQGVNVATSLPGICGASLMMPDAHQGYGFSIGGVAAIDCEKGCISPGGIGFDINCGVRLLATSLTVDDVRPRIREVLDVLFKRVPPGVGGQSLFRLDDAQLHAVLRSGASWCVDNSYGVQGDLDHCEEDGSLEGLAKLEKVSPRAKARGRKQLGTLGAGNHFLEVQVVDEIIDPKVAAVFGIKEKGQIVIMIHCGSRGLGHQVCSDYLRRMENTFPEIMASLPEKDLIYAPAQSDLAKDYFGAMCAAANFAWANRHMIGHQVREGLRELFGEKTEVKTVYDVAHNIAKLEEHVIDGEKRKVWVHRKGATRAFPPGHPAVPKDYQKVGQPILIPGSMGTSSYVLVGTEKAMQESFGSTAHGAGRLMSRKQANATWRGEDLKKELEEKKIYVKAASWRGVSEEAPGAYKDVSEVVKVSHDAGIGNLVAKVVPLGVVKG